MKKFNQFVCMILAVALFCLCGSAAGADSYVALPEDLTTIGEEAFAGCTSIENVAIRENVTNIGAGAFAGCTGINYMIFMGSAPEIGANAFSGVEAFVNYPVYYASWQDRLGNYGGELTWSGYGGSSEPAVNPGEGTVGENLTWVLDDAGVLTISGTGPMMDFAWNEDAPWGNRGVKTVVIEPGVTSIGDRAFKTSNNVTSVEIPNTVTRIGSQAFTYCEKLSEIEIPASVTDIPDMAFNLAGFRSIRVSNDNPAYKSVDGILFSKDGTELIYYPVKKSGDSYVIPDGVTKIYYNAFLCVEGLCSVSIPNSVENFEDWQAFFGCRKLEEILVGARNTQYQSIDGVLFSKDGTSLIRFPAGKKLSSYVIPNTVTEIGSSAFEGASNLTSVMIPDGVTRIYLQAFGGTSLTAVTIPASVQYMGSDVFYWCEDLTDITFRGSAPESYGGVFGNITATVHYPANDPTWTEEVRQNYGSTVTWEAYTPGA